MADVSGHGASSAFVTVYLKTLVSGFISNFNHGNDQILINPAQVLRRINRVLIREDLGKYLTLFYGILDSEEEKLTYSAGGQYPFPLLKTKEETRYIRKKGPPVGLMSIAEYQNSELDLPEVFSLLLCSDGVLDLLKAGDTAEKEQTLLDLYSRNETLEKLSKAMDLGIEKSLPDDITLLMIRRDSR